MFASYAEYEKAIRNERNLKQRLSRQDLVQMQAVPSRQGTADLQDSYRTGKLLKHRSTIFPDTYEDLTHQKADILVTHEAPSCHPHGLGAIDVLARKMSVKALFHGHQHDCLHYSLAFDVMSFRAYGVGFCGISSWDPTTGRVEVVMPGDFDQARRSMIDSFVHGSE